MPVKKSFISSLLENQKLAPHLFLIPFVIILLIFSLFPIFFSLFLSFQKWKGMGAMKFMGFENFIFILTKDPYFWKSVGVTTWLLVFGTFSQHLFAIPLAILLNNKALKGRGFFKTAFFLPFITSSIAVTIIFKFVFADHSGMMNFLLEFIGLKPVLWMQSKESVPIVIATIINWRYIGWNTVIYLAGLQSIPDSYYEAADIDGASFFQKHFRVTLPLLMPILFFTFSLSIIFGMQVFDEPFVLTGGPTGGMGGPGMSGFTSAYYIMWLTLRAGKLGRGSAVSWILFIFVLLMTMLNRFVTNKLQGKEE